VGFKNCHMSDMTDFIIESVDSNVGIARTRNLTIPKKSLKNGKLISLYNNVPFIFKCFNDQQHSQQREKTSRRYQTRNLQNGPNVFLSSFFFFLLLSSFFRRASSIPREPLTLVYTRNSSILYGEVHNPIAFSQLRSLARHLQPLTHKL